MKFKKQRNSDPKSENQTKISSGVVEKLKEFDEMCESLIKQKAYDEDDFKLDTMEVLSYYK